MKRILVVILIGLLSACQNQHTNEQRVRHPALDALQEPVRRTLENGLGQWRAQLSEAQNPSVRAQAYAQLGQVYLAHHFYDAAADALSIATTLSDSNPHWFFYLAKAKEHSYRLQEAQIALTRSLELQRHQEVLFTRADIRFRLGDSDGALADLVELGVRLASTTSGPESEQNANISGKSQSAWYALMAHVLFDQRRYADAINALERALSHDPSANALNLSLMQLKNQSGEKPQQLIVSVESDLRTPVIEQPLMDALSSLARGSAFYLDRGYHWMGLRNFEQAVTDFGAAVDIAPSDADAHLAYARALEIVGRVDAAKREYLESLVLRERSSVAHYFLGALYERQKQDELAREQYVLAVEADSTYLPPRELLAHALYRDAQFEEALQHYSYLAQADDRHLESRYFAGLAALAIGDCPAALVWFEQAAAINSYDRGAQEGIARSFAVCSDDPDELSRAQDIGERLEEARPDASAAATLAMVYAALNDYESAIRLQELAVRRSSSDRQLGQRDRLTLYQSGVRAKQAWLQGDAVFSPPRLTARVLP